MINLTEHAWIDRYAPKTIDELIATDAMRQTMNRIVEQGRIPDMLLVGPPGIGKTAMAKLLCSLLGVDSMLTNSSLKGNIDTLRNEIMQFAGTVSLSGAGKCAILDEADGLNAQSTQPALRNFIDTFRNNCSFVLTANYRNKIIEPLRKRLEVHEFKIDRADIPKLVMQMTKRCETILESEGIPFDKPSLVRFIGARAPDWRTCLIELQAYARDHKEINAGILAVRTLEIDSLPPLFKAKDFEGLRKWVGENTDSAAQELFTDLAEGLQPHVIPQSLPMLYMILARYAYQSAFVADQQVNFAAAFAEIMTECLFV